MTNYTSSFSNFHLLSYHNVLSLSLILANDLYIYKIEENTHLSMQFKAEWDENNDSLLVEHFQFDDDHMWGSDI